MLSERRQRILRIVVDSYLESGEPVGSKAIAGRDDVEWGASTVRAELAGLEQEGNQIIRNAEAELAVG